MTEIVPKTPAAESPPPPRDPEGRMTFTAHLGELRTRMIRSIIAVLVGAIVGYIFSERITDALREPLGEVAIHSAKTEAMPPVGTEAPGAPKKSVELMVITPFEGFMVKLKISGYAGLLLALPVIIWEICAFVFPGLTATEKRIVKIMLFGGLVLALVGVSVAYFGILRLALPSVLAYVPDGVKVSLGLSVTLSVILKVLLAFAIAFQMPMIVLVLVYVGILTPATLKAYRKVAIVGIFIFAAVLTPPDVFSQLAMAIPLLFLYEFSILVSHLVVRRKAKAAAAAGA